MDLTTAKLSNFGCEFFISAFNNISSSLLDASDLFKRQPKQQKSTGVKNLSQHQLSASSISSNTMNSMQPGTALWSRRRLIDRAEDLKSPGAS
eukprot:scaffold36478_cov69-Cyclotella_meneghiniana.AAC.5